MQCQILLIIHYWKQGNLEGESGNLSVKSLKAFFQAPLIDIIIIKYLPTKRLIYRELRIPIFLRTMIAVKSSGKNWQGFYQLDHVAMPSILFDTLVPKDVAFQDRKSKINLSYYKEYNIFISKLFKCIFLVGV